MSAQNENIFYSSPFKKIVDSHTTETFIDHADYKWVTLIETNYLTIKDEVLKHFNSNLKEFNPYFADELTTGSGKWRSFGFYFWGIRASDNSCNHFTKTIKLLKQIPGIVSASVSVMEPDSEIKPHFGDTNAIHRCHLGLVIPETLPKVGFQVGYEMRAWQNGKVLIFNDAAYHKAWNHSNEKRVVLIFDVIRSPYINQKLWICSRVNTIIWIQHIAKQNPRLVNLIRLMFLQKTMALYVFIKHGLFKRKWLWL